MIKYSEVIKRIREQCAAFSNRVGASAAFGAAINNSSDLPVPHCFVMPVDFKDFSLIEYDESYPETLKIKVTRESFSTIVCIDNSINRGHRSGDTQGVIPLDLLNTLQEQLEAAFVLWKPTGLPKGAGDINLIGGEYVDSDNMRLWYQFEWAILYKRSSFGLTPEQEAEIDAIVSDLSPEDSAMMAAINNIRIRNPLSDSGLTEPDPLFEDSYGQYPDGPVDQSVKDDADSKLDVNYEQQEGDHNCTNREVEDSASSEFMLDGDPFHKGPTAIEPEE